MTFLRLAVAVTIFGLSGCATHENSGTPSSSAQSQTASETTKPEKSEAGKTAENEPELICRRERQTGSNRPRRVCYPASNMTSGDGAR
jgi:hypothetical protein